MIKRGILWGGFHNVCFTHSEEDLNHTLQAYEEVLPLLVEAIQKGNIESMLLGKPVEAVFRKVGNVQKAFSEKVLQVK
jgi:glutamate-1-semialdehyde 2,1-aminomutase